MRKGSNGSRHAGARWTYEDVRCRQPNGQINGNTHVESLPRRPYLNGRRVCGVRQIRGVNNYGFSGAKLLPHNSSDGRSNQTKIHALWEYFRHILGGKIYGGGVCSGGQCVVYIWGEALASLLRRRVGSRNGIRLIVCGI